MRVARADPDDIDLDRFADRRFKKKRKTYLVVTVEKLVIIFQVTADKFCFVRRSVEAFYGIGILLFGPAVALSAIVFDAEQGFGFAARAAQKRAFLINNFRIERVGSDFQRVGQRR